ncbi:reticulocalbin-2 [Trichogramma pretiosum]|uniref:reticulocalbin-2 n=1 Tax=Trichogramma pretiosum TaxID=7493 RepID=UPI0006C95D46|nr:reticulocalbin-2 [Trichogramma pretiosum]
MQLSKIFCSRLGCIALLMLCCSSLDYASAASAHIHTQHGKGGSKERTEDGAFSPRDSGHYQDGEHHNEFDHEAILGSVREAEEFDKLPIEESKRRLKVLLTKMDLNLDQFIERNELKAWILRSFKMLSDEESKDRLEDADSDEDGRVTWDEILQDTYGTDPEDLAIEDKAIQNDKDTFDVADLNQDGYLNPIEFKAYTHPEEEPRMMDIIMKQAMEDYDKDGDSYVSFQEFLGARAESHDKEWLLVEKEKFDNEYDKDKDGKLNQNEMKAWLIPSNEDIADDEVEHLFAASDDDHDNRLSFEEILEHHDVFVGSEATDYGDHLQEIHRFEDEL